MDRLSISQAITRGHMCVSAPVFFLLLGPAFFANRIYPKDLQLLAILALTGFILGWAYWSVAVPRWRVWAYERVDDLDALDKAAVASGLTWPKGLFFGRTELKSARLAARERELSARRQP